MVRLKPIIFTLVYLYFTLFIYFFGEYNWNINNKIQLFIVVSIYYLFIGIGGLAAIKLSTNFSIITIKKIDIDFFLLLRFSYIYSIISYIVMSYYYGQGFINIFDLSLISEIYLDKAQTITYDKNFAVQFLSWFWVFTYMFIPLSIIKWSNLSTLDKILFFITIITCIFYWLSIGTLKGVGDLILQLLISFEIRRYINVKKEKQKNKFKNKIKIISLVFLFILLFSAIQENRSAAVYGNTNSMERLPSVIQPFIKETREYPIDSSIKRLMFYFSHGYTGMALSLEENFEWTKMVGFSRSLSEIFESRTGIEVTNKTYLSNIEGDYGWPNGMVWSTVFPWIAGDITFYLIPIIMFFVGFSLIKLWNKIIKDLNSNLLKVLIFIQLSIFVVYIPMNNQIVQSRQSLFTNIMLILFVLIINIKVNGKVTNEHK